MLIETIFNRLLTFEPFNFHPTESVKMFSIDNHSVYLFDTNYAYNIEDTYENEIERGVFQGLYYIIDLIQ